MAMMAVRKTRSTFSNPAMGWRSQATTVAPATAKRLTR
jgi:hypothetical protein